MISIIIPFYNSHKTLPKALRSVSKQTYKDIEVIVVDDGSQVSVDKSLSTAYEFPISIHQIEHGGANKARNIGFAKSQGDYVIFWDADVVGKPDMLERMCAALERNQKASYAYSQHRWGLKKFHSWHFDADRLRNMPYIHTTSLIRRGDFPGFDESVERLQDWDLWLTMLEKSYIGVFVPKVLFRVITGGSMSSWMPKYAYQDPFKQFLPRKWLAQAEKYNTAIDVIKDKHSL